MIFLIIIQLLNGLASASSLFLCRPACRSSSASRGS
jgi:hypothetical protein